MKKLSAVICLILSLVLLSSCGGSSEPAETASVPGIKSEIIGTWKYESYSEYRDLITTLITDSGVYYDVYYIFNSDGTGETYMSTNTVKFEFTYTYDGKTLTITGIGDGEAPFDTKVAVSGDQMQVHDDQKDKDLIFYRQ